MRLYGFGLVCFEDYWCRVPWWRFGLAIILMYYTITGAREILQRGRRHPVECGEWWFSSSMAVLRYGSSSSPIHVCLCVGRFGHDRYTHTATDGGPRLGFLVAGMECFCWLVWLICSLAAVSSWWLLRLLFWGLSFSRRGTKKGPFLMTVLFRIYYCEGCTEDGHRHSLIIIIILDTTNTHWKRCVWAVVLSLSLWVVMVILPTKDDCGSCA